MADSRVQKAVSNVYSGVAKSFTVETIIYTESEGKPDDFDFATGVYTKADPVETTVNCIIEQADGNEKLLSTATSDLPPITRGDTLTLEGIRFRILSARSDGYVTQLVIRKN